MTSTAGFPATVQQRAMLEDLARVCHADGYKPEDFAAFFKVYQGPLEKYLRQKLHGPHEKREQDAEEYVQAFMVDQLRKLSTGLRTVFATWDSKDSKDTGEKAVSFRSLLQTSCWRYVLQVRGTRCTSPEQYEHVRALLVDHVRCELRRPHVPPSLELNAEDYVETFLEYHASRYSLRPPKTWGAQRRQEEAGEKVSRALGSDERSPADAFYDKLKDRCWAYVEWWLVRPDLPAWDYLAWRDALIEHVASVAAGVRTGTDENSDLEGLVDRFLKLYGARHLRVKRSDEQQRTSASVPQELRELCCRFVCDPRWRKRFENKPADALERVRSARPRPRWAVEYDQDVYDCQQPSPRRGNGQEHDKLRLWARPGANLVHSFDAADTHERWYNEMDPDGDRGEDREWFNALALDVFRCYLHQFAGTKYVRLLRGRALEPFAQGQSKARPYEEICEQCGFPGKDRAEKKRSTELAWATVQDQIKGILRRVLEDRASAAPPGLSRDKLVEQQIREFHRLLRAEARRCGQPRNEKNQDALRQHVQELDRPDLSGSSADLPALNLADCSLDWIAYALIEDAPQPTFEDRQRDWAEYLELPLKVFLGGQNGSSEGDRAEGRAVPQPRNEPSGRLPDDWHDLTLAELLHDPQPPLELLANLKRLLRARYKAADGEALPDTIIAAYLACIAAGLVATGQLLTRKSPCELSGDLKWLAGEAWIDSETRKLSNRALTCL